jgi:hypothetical protein
MGETVNSKINQGFKNILKHEDKKAEAWMEEQGYRKVKLPVNTMNDDAIDSFTKEHGITMIDMGDGVRIDSRLHIGNPNFKISDLFDPKKKFIKKELKIIIDREQRKFQKKVKRQLREEGRKRPQFEHTREGIRYKMDTHLNQGTPGISSKHPELGRIRSYYIDTETGKEIKSGTHIRKTGGTRKVVEGYAPKRLDAPIQRDKKNRGLMKKARTKRMELKIKKIQKELKAKNLSEKKAARLGEKIRIIRLGIQKPKRGK